MASIAPFRFAQSLVASPSNAADDSFAQGYAAGQVDAAAQITGLADQLAAMATQLEQQQSATLDDIAAAAAQLALVAAEHLAGQALAHTPLGPIAGALHSAISSLPRGTDIAITVNPDHAAAMEARLKEMHQNERRQVSLSVSSDAALVLGDARFSWDGGGAILCRAQRRAAVASLIATLGNDMTEDESAGPADASPAASDINQL